jgi:hypothetical protein
MLTGRGRVEDVSDISLKEDVLEAVATNPSNFNYMSKPCCGSAAFWYPGSESGSASNKNQDPDPYPDPHQSDKLDPNPHHFADDKPKRKEYTLI